MKTKLLAAAIACIEISGCASIVAGTSEEITVNTNPPGADCAINRQGVTIARVNPTPAAATIKKTKYDITIVCTKPGYQQASYMNHSGVQGSTVGNVLLGGGIGWAIDSASGADNHYESPVNITMVPIPPAPVTTPSPIPPQTTTVAPAAPAPASAPAPGV